MGYQRQKVFGTSPLDIKKLNDNFENIWYKTFGDIDFGDINYKFKGVIDGKLTLNKPTGITTVNDDGTIKTEHEKSASYSTLDYEGLKIYNKQDKVIASFGDDDKAIIGTVECDIVNSPSVIPQLRDKGTLSVYVSAVSTGDSSGKDASNRSSSIVTALTNLFASHKLTWNSSSGIILTNTNVNVYVQGSGSFTENIYIRDFIGEGVVNFDISKDLELTGSWSFSNCKRVYFNGNRTGHSNDDGARFKRNAAYDSLYFHSCLNVELLNCRFYSTVQSHSGLSCRYGTNAFVSTCDFYGGNHAIYLDNNAKCHTYNTRGHNFGTRAYTINQGCFMVWERSTPTGSKASFLGGYGTETKGEGVTSTQENSLQATVPETSNKVFTQDFSPSSIFTVRSGSTTSGVLRQGTWTGSDYVGYCDFGNTVKDWLSNAAGGVTMQVYLERLNDNHGYYFGVPVILSGTDIGTLSLGEGKWFTVPTTVVTSLQNGGYITLNGSGQSQYIKFNTNVSLRVTATKPA